MKLEKLKKAYKAILVALGLGTAVGTTTIALDSGRAEKEVKAEESLTEAEAKAKAEVGIGILEEKEFESQNQTEQKSNYFKEQYHYDTTAVGLGILEEKERQENAIRVKVNSEVDRLESAEEELDYLKNIYLEARGQESEEENLTARDIKITTHVEANYHYKDLANGDIITHGDLPKITDDLLQQAGINYEIVYGDITVYTVLKNGKFWDCVAIDKNEQNEETPVRVIKGNQYETYKEYQSILKEKKMHDVIIDGIYFYEHFDDPNAKENFVESIVEYEGNNKQNGKEDWTLEQ